MDKVNKRSRTAYGRGPGAAREKRVDARFGGYSPEDADRHLMTMMAGMIAISA